MACRTRALIGSSGWRFGGRQSLGHEVLADMVGHVGEPGSTRFVHLADANQDFRISAMAPPRFGPSPPHRICEQGRFQPVALVRSSSRPICAPSSYVGENATMPGSQFRLLSRTSTTSPGAYAKVCQKTGLKRQIWRGLWQESYVKIYLQ